MLKSRIISLKTDLRSYIVGRANNVSELLPWFEVSAEAKVCKLEGGSICLITEQEVFGLDVTMHDAQLVKVMHNFYHGPKVVCREVLSSMYCATSNPPEVPHSQDVTGLHHELQGLAHPMR